MYPVCFSAAFGNRCNSRVLGQYGDEADLNLALPVLKDLAPADKNGVYVSMEALNAIDVLDGKAVSLLDTLKAMPHRDPSAVNRSGEYVPRLLDHFFNEVGARR